MKALLKNDHLSILQAATTSLWLGNSSLLHGPDMMRLTGARPAEDQFHLHLYVPEKYTFRFLENIRENKKVSHLFSCVYTFKTFQVKGLYVAHRHCTPDENSYQHTYLEEFGKTAVNIGINSGMSFINYWEDPAICFIIRPQEIFEQTPKPGAGNKIS